MRVSVTARSTAPLRDTLPLRRGLRAAMPGIAGDMARGIRQRTESGRDVAGKPFPRKRDGSPSNLIDSGRMVESFEPLAVTDDGFRLAPKGKRNRAVAAIHQATGRRWVGADERQIETARERAIEAAIPRDRNRE